MKIKVINAFFTDVQIINQLEEDVLFLEQNNYAIHDFVDSKGRYELDVYLTESADEKAMITYLQQTYPELTDFKINLQKQEDWFEKWQQSLKPLWLTEQFLVDPATNPKNEIKLIKITPGMAFGTGYHETTRLTAQLLQQYAQKHDQMLDLGCGSGILSIMGAQLGCQVTAVDLDPFAIEVTNENIRRNRVSASVTVIRSDLLQAVQGKFDLICANILFDVLKLLFSVHAKDLKRVIHLSTTLIFSGLILKQHDDFKKLIESEGFTIINTLSEGDWLTIAVKLKKTEVIE
ncbi:MAG: 50S ribosomal protein L11 methyltransferase [Thermotogota bacterium]